MIKIDPSTKKTKHEQQETVLQALSALKATSTTEEIANKAGIPVSITSRILSALGGSVIYLGGRRGNAKWRLRNEPKQEQAHSNSATK